MIEHQNTIEQMCSNDELSAVVEDFKAFKQEFNTHKSAILQNNFKDIEQWCTKHESALSFIGQTD